MKDKLLYIITLPITLYIVFKLKRDRKKRLILSAYGKEILRKFEEKGTSLDIDLK